MGKTKLGVLCFIKEELIEQAIAKAQNQMRIATKELLTKPNKVMAGVRR